MKPVSGGHLQCMVEMIYKCERVCVCLCVLDTAIHVALSQNIMTQREVLLNMTAIIIF